MSPAENASASGLEVPLAELASKLSAQSYSNSERKQMLEAAMTVSRFTALACKVFSGEVSDPRLQLSLSKACYALIAVSSHAVNLLESQACWVVKFLQLLVVKERMLDSKGCSIGVPEVLKKDIMPDIRSPCKQ